MSEPLDRPSARFPGAVAPVSLPLPGPSLPAPRDRAWLVAYPDRRRILAARRRRLEQALFLEDERAHAWRRLRLASWALVLAGLLLVGLGLPSRGDLAFLAGAVLFVIGGLGLATERVGQASREERRRWLADRLSRLVRRGDEMDARARELAASLGMDPWQAALRLREEEPPAGVGRVSGDSAR